MIDIKKLNEAIGSSGWMLEGTDIDTNGINSKLTIRLYGNRQKQEDREAWREEYRAKQEAGVKFEKFMCDESWIGAKENGGYFNFSGKKEDYREVPRQIMEAVNELSEWFPAFNYRVKPMKLTARIARYGIHIGEIKIHDWEFTGTREEYRAECEKYGYVVVSEIKEVKHKTVKHYFALCLCKPRKSTFSISDLTAEEIQRRAKNGGFTIIGDIEQREVEA